MRPDVRIMNMSYLAGDWYVKQMTHKYNDSEPVPFSLPVEKYTGGVNDRVYIDERTTEAVPLRDLIDFVASEDIGTKFRLSDGTLMDYIPTRTAWIPVDKENAVASGIVRPEDAHLMVDSIPIRINAHAIDKNDLMLLDLLASFEWKRPLYFVFQQKLYEYGLIDYVQFDGFGYRLVPIRTEGGPRVDAEYLWRNLMELDRYGNVKDPRVNCDYFADYMFNVLDARYGFVLLADGMMAKGDTVRAVTALDRAVEELPFSQLGYTDAQDVPLIEAYYAAGETQKANAILEDYSRVLREYIDYFSSFHGEKANRAMGPLSEKLRSLQRLYGLASHYGQEEPLVAMEEVFDKFGI